MTRRKLFDQNTTVIIISSSRKSIGLSGRCRIIRLLNLAWFTPKMGSAGKEPEENNRTVVRQRVKILAK